MSNKTYKAGNMPWKRTLLSTAVALAASNQAFAAECATTISANVVGGCTISVENAVTINSGVTVNETDLVNTSTSMTGIYLTGAGLGAGADITNNGTISAVLNPSTPLPLPVADLVDGAAWNNYATGIWADGNYAGLITNSSSGTISGTTTLTNTDTNTATSVVGSTGASAWNNMYTASGDGIYVGGNMTAGINNSGTISGAATINSAAIGSATTTFAASDATAYAYAYAYADAAGIYVDGDSGDVVNAGTISGNASSTSTATATATATDDAYADAYAQVAATAYGIEINGDTGAITNSGTISGTASATANATATAISSAVANGSKDSYGTAYAWASASGIDINGIVGLINNTGTISADATASAGVTATGTSTDTWTYAGASASAIYARGYGSVGGLTNSSTGTISATATAEDYAAAYGVQLFADDLGYTPLLPADPQNPAAMMTAGIGQIGNISNANLITATATASNGDAYARAIELGAEGAGQISWVNPGATALLDVTEYLTNYGTIGNITNTGTISASASGHNTEAQTVTDTETNLYGSMYTYASTSTHTWINARATGIEIDSDITGILNNSGTISGTADATIARTVSVTADSTATGTAYGRAYAYAYAYAQAEATGINLDSDTTGAITNSNSITGTATATLNNINSAIANSNSTGSNAYGYAETYGFAYASATAWGMDVNSDVAGDITNTGTISGIANSTNTQTYSATNNASTTALGTNDYTYAYAYAGTDAYAFAYGLNIEGDITGNITNSTGATISAVANATVDASIIATAETTSTRQGNLYSEAYAYSDGYVVASATGLNVYGDITGNVTNNGTISGAATASNTVTVDATATANSINYGNSYGEAAAREWAYADAYGLRLQGVMTGDISNTGTISASANALVDVTVNAAADSTVLVGSGGDHYADAYAYVDAYAHANATGLDIQGSTGDISNSGTISATATISTSATATATANGNTVMTDAADNSYGEIDTDNGYAYAYAYGVHHSTNSANAYGVAISGGTNGFTETEVAAVPATPGHLALDAYTMLTANAPSIVGDITNTGTVTATATADAGTIRNRANATAMQLHASGSDTDTYTQQVEINGAVVTITNGVAESASISGNLTNSGTISAVAQSDAIDGEANADGLNMYAWGVDNTYAWNPTDGAYLVYSFATISGDVNNSGTISAAATADYTDANAYASAVDISAENITGDFINSGNITAEANAALGSASASAFSLYTAGGYDADINNSGTISANAQGAGTARADGVDIYHGDNSYGLLTINTGDVNNTGTISAFAESEYGDAYANGFDQYSNGLTGSVTNSNAITATAKAYDYAYATGAYIGSYQGDITVNNAGTISAAAEADYGYAYAYGLSLESREGVMNLNNSGVITADADSLEYARAYGVQVDSYGSTGELTNSGSITANAVSEGDYDADAKGFRLATNDAINFTNNGVITASANSADDYASAYGMDLDSNESTGVISNAATIGASALGDDSWAVGMYVNDYFNGAFTNSSSITADAQVNHEGSADAVGMAVDNSGADSTIINSGTINANADGGYSANATGFGQYVLNGAFTNSGTINATATATAKHSEYDYAAASGVAINTVSDTAVFSNTGFINASATTTVGNIDDTAQATGLYVGSLNADIANAGTISTTAVVSNAGTYKSYGVFIQDNTYGHTFTNDNTITADAIGGLDSTDNELYAIYSHGATNIVNNGSITGAVHTEGDFTAGVGSSQAIVLQSVETNANFNTTVTGTADLRESVLSVKLTSDDTVSSGDVFVDIIDAGTLVIDADQLGSLQDNLYLYDFELAYDATNASAAADNNLDLTVNRDAFQDSVQGMYANVAAALEAMYQSGAACNRGTDAQCAEMNNFINSLDNVASQQELEALLLTVTPAFNGQTAWAAARDVGAINDAIINRSNGSGASSGDAMANKKVWAKIINSDASHDKTNDAFGYDVENGGLVIGFDSDATSTTRVGVALALTQGEVDGNGAISSQNVEMDNAQVLVYADMDLGNNRFANVQGGFGVGDNDLTTTAGTVNYNSNVLSLRGGYGANINLGDSWTVAPVVSLSYINLSEDDYSLGLIQVADRDSDSLEAGIDGNFGYAVNKTVTITSRVGLGYDFLADATDVNASFVTGGGQFSHDTEQDVLTLRAGLGLDVTPTESTSFSVNYDFSDRGDFGGNTISAKVNQSF